MKLQRKIFLDGNAVTMDSDAVTITGERETHVFALDEIDAMAAVGKKKFNFYYHGKIYQIKGNERFCGVKYVHAFYGLRAAEKAQAQTTQPEEQTP